MTSLTNLLKRIDRHRVITVALAAVLVFSGINISDVEGEIEFVTWIVGASGLLGAAAKQETRTTPIESSPDDPFVFKP